MNAVRQLDTHKLGLTWEYEYRNAHTGNVWKRSWFKRRNPTSRDDAISMLATEIATWVKGTSMRVIEIEQRAVSEPITKLST